MLSHGTSHKDTQKLWFRDALEINTFLQFSAIFFIFGKWIDMTNKRQVYCFLAGIKIVSLCCKQVISVVISVLSALTLNLHIFLIFISRAFIYFFTFINGFFFLI